MERKFATEGNYFLGVQESGGITAAKTENSARHSRKLCRSNGKRRCHLDRSGAPFCDARPLSSRPESSRFCEDAVERSPHSVAAATHFAGTEDQCCDLSTALRSGRDDTVGKEDWAEVP